MSIFWCSVLLLPSPVPQAANVTAMLSSTGPASHEPLVIVDDLPSTALRSPAIVLTISCDAFVISESLSEARVPMIFAIRHAYLRASDASAEYRSWCIFHCRKQLTRKIEGFPGLRKGLVAAWIPSMLPCTWQDPNCSCRRSGFASRSASK